MEISNNQNIYINYQKTKKEDSVLPIEVFKIDKSEMVENLNKPTEQEKLYHYGVYVLFSDTIKDFDKDTLLSNDKDSKNQLFWDIPGSINYEWSYQHSIATFGNVFEDAKDFEDFIRNWIEKGDTEAEALERATFYAAAGLLDYGKQKLAQIPYLEYDDKKQHGFHQIDNPPLKKAFLETLDSLDINSVSLLVFNLFPNGENSSSFKDLLKEYGVKLENLKQNQPEEERSKFTFTGDININDKMSLEYQNFIFDTLIGFFKDRVNSFDNDEEAKRRYSEDNIDKLKNAYNTLIENFKKNTKEYNETKNILNQYMK